MLVNRQNPRRAFRRCSRIAYNRTFDAFRRAQETAVVVTNVRHSAKIRLYDSEDRVCGYALTNAAGRGVSVSLAYDGSYVTNTVYTLPNGSIFSARLSREAGRRNLVTRRDYFFGGQSIYWYSTEYDLLNRPTNATDSVSLVREWLYNRRSELAAATVGADSYGYAYDSIGNRLWSAANDVTKSYTANSLNQYTAVSAGANPVYDADGNMTGDGTFAYAYDAENRLVSVTSAAETNGAIRVLNAYDHSNRRIRKTVQRLNSSIAPPPSPPVGMHEWETQETHTFVWDGNNIVLEKVEFANGTTRTFEYFWGADKSGTEQGAGGVEGLLAVSIDGVFYIPCYDHNGNIILYVSETGSIAAQYTYDPYGNIIESSGPLADVFSFGFSTQYHDRETGMVGYKHRFYRPDLGRWLNRDPIEEEGGENVYCFVENSPSWLVDLGGLHTFQFTDKGWSYGDTLSGALTDNVSVLGATRTSRTSSSKCSCNSGKWSPDYTFKVEVYSLIQFADDSTWDDDNYGSGVRDPRVREKWDSFGFFEARRRRNLVIEHEERHRKHAQKNYNAIVRELNVSEQYSSKGVCESKASEKIAAAIRLFDLMERADEEKVERGDL